MIHLKDFYIIYFEKLEKEVKREKGKEMLVAEQ